MNFLRPSAFNVPTDGLNSSFQSLNERKVHHETYKRFWVNCSPNFTKKFISEKKINSRFSLNLIHNLNPAYKNSSLRNRDHSIQFELFTPEKFPKRSLINHKNVLFQLSLRILILIAFQPQMFNRVHFWQMCLTTY